LHINSSSMTLHRVESHSFTCAHGTSCSSLLPHRNPSTNFRILPAGTRSPSTNTTLRLTDSGRMQYQVIRGLSTDFGEAATTNICLKVTQCRQLGSCDPCGPFSCINKQGIASLTWILSSDRKARGVVFGYENFGTRVVRPLV